MTVLQRGAALSGGGLNPAELVRAAGREALEEAGEIGDVQEGRVKEPSQLAAGSPAANFCRKQVKSAVLRKGGAALRSQLA